MTEEYNCCDCGEEAIECAPPNIEPVSKVKGILMSNTTKKCLAAIDACMFHTETESFKVRDALDKRLWGAADYHIRKCKAYAHAANKLDMKINIMSFKGIDIR